MSRKGMTFVEVLTAMVFLGIAIMLVTRGFHASDEMAVQVETQGALNDVRDFVYRTIDCRNTLRHALATCQTNSPSLTFQPLTPYDMFGNATPLNSLVRYLPCPSSVYPPGGIGFTFGSSARFYVQVGCLLQPTTTTPNLLYARYVDLSRNGNHAGRCPVVEKLGNASLWRYLFWEPVNCPFSQ